MLFGGISREEKWDTSLSIVYNGDFLSSMVERREEWKWTIMMGTRNF